MSTAVEPIQPLVGTNVARISCLDLCTPLVTTGVAVTGAVAVAFLTHKLSKRRESIARFSAASLELRIAFADELAFLESTNDPYFDIQRYLLQGYDAKHRAAIAIFEHFVPDSKRDRFAAAWHQYHSGQQAGGEPLDMFEMGSPYDQAMFIEYSGYPFSHPTMSARELAICRIRTLLAFASHP